MKRPIVLLAAFSLLGCGRSSGPVEAPKEYALRGVILSLNPERRTATISHEKIEGWMEKMTMEFPVKDRKEFAKLRAGQHIRAKVFQHPSDFEFWIGGIEAVEPPPAGP
jgi:Cu/Ag efflux protein CusF